MTPSRLFPAVIVLALLPALQSIPAGAADTVTLTPAQTRSALQHQTAQSESACAAACALPAGEESCAVPAEGAAPLVGYDNTDVKASSSGCACWLWRGCIYRAFATFELAPLAGRRIVEADLRWEATTTGSVIGGHCLSAVHVAAPGWDEFGKPGETLAANLSLDRSPIGRLDISHLVRGWVDGSRPNKGIVFVGVDERFLKRSPSDCLSRLENLQLEVRTVE